MPRPFPDPDTRHPIILPGGTPHIGTVFLAAEIDHPRITVGAYTYASADVPPADWAMALAPYLFPSSPEQLTIGRFCQIAHGVCFITASANHRYDGISSYPFAVFQSAFDMDRPSLPGPGPDTVVGHDVWIGRNAMILPGSTLGDGVIVGAGAVVGGTVPPYTIVAGNPARVLRQRFTPEQAAALSRLAWWHWPIEEILANESAICGSDIAALEAAAARRANNHPDAEDAP